MDIKQLFKHWTYQIFAPSALLRDKYNAFKSLLRYDNLCLEIIADLEEIHYGRERVDWTRIVWLYNRLSHGVRSMVAELELMNPARYLDLKEYYRKLDFYVRLGLDLPGPDPSPPYILPLQQAAAHPELVGGKAANLSRVAALPGFDVPPGFVVTVKAFHYLIESNELRPKLDRKLRRIKLQEPDTLAEISTELEQLILEAQIPDNLAHEIEEAVGGLIGVQGRDVPRLAVRSSAVAEDSAISFAGQYRSELNVAPYEVLQAYKRVLAGKYAAKALTYRIGNGLADQETPMAVLFLPMVRAKAAGVVYTVDCSPKGQCAAAVYAVPGLGHLLVDGSLSPEVQYFSQVEPPVPLQQLADPLLPQDTARKLVSLSLRLERRFGLPLDIEWALDIRGNLFFLQARPLHLRLQEEEEAGEALPEKGVKPLLEGGVCASSGAAAGKVFHVHSVMDVGSVPKGSVVVTQTLTPALARLAGYAVAVVARSGSRASHFASVAREYGLPVLVAAQDPLEILVPGETVTVHADAGVVYPDRQEELLAQVEQDKPQRTGPVAERLQAVLPQITRLTLTDPTAATFAPENCRSLHDVVRFTHEKSVSEMFSLVGKGGRGLSQARQLKSHLPLTMYLLDLGGGLFPASENKDEVTPDDIRSQPMWAFWFGLAAEDVPWDSRLLHVDWEAMDRIAAGIFSKDTMLLASYAVLSKDYLHMMLRFGYHFSVLDALCGPEAKNNYIKFRFKGGGAEFEQRLLRLEIIKRVLEHFGFTTSIRGDMLDAQLSRESEGVTQKRLASLGYLLARTRLLDMGLRNERQVQELVKEFIERREPEL